MDSTLCSSGVVRNRCKLGSWKQDFGDLSACSILSILDFACSAQEAREHLPEDYKRGTYVT